MTSATHKITDARSVHAFNDRFMFENTARAETILSMIPARAASQYGREALQNQCPGCTDLHSARQGKHAIEPMTSEPDRTESSPRPHPNSAWRQIFLRWGASSMAEADDRTGDKSLIRVAHLLIIRSLFPLSSHCNRYR